MTLLEAFQELAPPTEDLSPAVQARRQAAAEVVYAALQRVARRAVPGRPEADDLISLAFLRLLTKGPRPPRENDPTSDGGVEGFLVTCLRNQARDLFRRTRRFDSLDDGADGRARRFRLDAPAGDHDLANGYDLLRDGEGHALVARATEVLYDQALPALAALSADPDAFTRRVRDVRDLARQTTSIDAIVARDGLVPGPTSHNRLYKRYERARTTMLERLRPWLAASSLPPELDDAVRRLAEFDMASRVARGGRTS